MPQDDDHTILHQDDVEAVIAENVEGGVGADNAPIADASVAHALNATFSDVEVETALDDLGGTVNEILAALRNNGIVDEA